jgi:hypothetical protein
MPPTPFYYAIARTLVVVAVHWWLLNRRMGTLRPARQAALYYRL